MGETSLSDQIVVYSDFNCPFCYAMHERLHECGVFDLVEWRGVQHAPQLPIPMARWNGPLLDELRHEVAMVGRLAPTLPIVVPESKPNTGPAIQLAAKVLSSNVARGNDLVRQLYWLFWREGRDISDITILRETLTSMGLNHEEFLENDEGTGSVLESWTTQWLSTGQAGVPLLERADGRLLVGLAREGDLRRFLSLS
jgi:predicted DsbA family dithiol-disulfide isomerase